MSRRFATTILLGIAAITPSLSHVVADDAAKPARVLMLTESAGFKHGSVSRQDGQLSPADRPSPRPCSRRSAWRPRH